MELSRRFDPTVVLEAEKRGSLPIVQAEARRCQVGALEHRGSFYGFGLSKAVLSLAQSSASRSRSGDASTCCKIA